MKDWNDVPRYKGRLKINRNGEVYSLITNKVLKHSFLPSGYETIVLMLKNPRRSRTEYIHRLLAETFIPNPNNKETVNHINGIKSDNRLENLEWATQRENNIHALKNGLRIPNIDGLIAYNKSRRVLTENEVKFIKENKHLSTNQLAKLLNNTNIYVIYDCKRGRTWK